MVLHCDLYFAFASHIIVLLMQICVCLCWQHCTRDVSSQP